MTSKMRHLAAASALLTTVGGVAEAASRSRRTAAAVVKSGDIRVRSSLGRRLLSAARRVEGGGGAPDSRALEEGNWDYTYVADYSIKFQGCHHISQWNGEAEDEDDVRVYTKRLVRFRLCPTGSCDGEDTSGCSAKYGDYVVDMGAFLEAYLDARDDEKEYQCEVYEEKCEEDCGGDDDEDCMEACYAGYGMSYCLEDEDEDAYFDPQDYVECAQFDFGGRRGRRRLDGEAAYYVGPYCADQGGEIHLGLFTDDTCTTFSSLGEDGFYSMAGYELPYSDSPGLVNGQCMTCADNGDGDNNNDGDGDVKDFCAYVYSMSGKCETKMSIDYPNESACTYIEGIKIIREDGVIRTTTTKKSKAAAVSIGLFTTVAVLLGAYVYYLRTKLGRAKINLSSGSGALT